MTAHPVIYRGELYSDAEIRLAESIRDQINPEWDAVELAHAIRLAELTRTT